MSFIPESKTLVEGMGNPNADIFILGDCPDAYSLGARKPFSGPRETILEGGLHQAGLTKSEVYITNFIPDDTRLYKYWNEKSKSIVGDVRAYKDILLSELEVVAPRVVVPLGDLATYILTREGSSTKVRGYPFTGELDIGGQLAANVQVIPSLHPGKMIFSNYIWRYYLAHDLKKAKKWSLDKALVQRPSTVIPSSFSETRDILLQFSRATSLSIDIEVSNFEVSCIGFSNDPTWGASIPLDDRWTIQEEVTLWQDMEKILSNESITKIGQNFIFDIHFIAIRMGIITRGPIEDTMMAHSIMYPDFLKALSFLASIHTYVPYWKDLVNFKSIKAND